MKTFLINSLILISLTVSSLSASAQLRINFLKDIQMTGEGIVYNPAEATRTFTGNTLNSITKKIFSPVKAATELCTAIQFKYAQILNRDVESVTNLPLFSFINNWWGTKYRFGGTTKKGIDCSSFTGLLMGSVFAISLPRTAREQFARCVKIAKDKLTEGDLVFFNTRGGVSHVGIYLGAGQFVHSSSSKGVSISSLEDNYYKNRFIAGGRPETADYTAGNL